MRKQDIVHQPMLFTGENKELSLLLYKSILMLYKFSNIK